MMTSQRMVSKCMKNINGGIKRNLAYVGIYLKAVAVLIDVLHIFTFLFLKPRFLARKTSIMFQGVGI